VQHLEGNPEPGLKFRYSRGVGDIVACILHSKYIGIITHKITGVGKPCQKCSQRGMALNLLFPIPLWKLFFDSEEEMIESFKKDFIKAGYQVEEHGPKEFSASKINETPNPNFEPIIENVSTNDILNQPNNNLDYELISTSDNYIGEFKIQTVIYKQKNGNTSH
jgi:hypothetical protein